VYIYGSYRKIKTGLSLFWTTLYSVCPFCVADVCVFVCLYGLTTKNL